MKIFQIPQLVLLGALALAGCEADAGEAVPGAAVAMQASGEPVAQESPSSPVDRAAASAAATVTMTGGLSFEPRTVRISKGETVTWKNTSDVVHTVTANPEMASDPSHVKLPEGAEPFNSGDVQPGGEFSHTFDVAGEHKYFCIPHEAAGMLGTVIVE